MIGLNYPKTIMGYRPSKFSDRLKVEEMLKKGLDSSQRLYLNAGAHVNGVDTLGLSDWTECIDNDFCNKGLEGTMSIYDHLRREERNITTSYGSITMDEVVQWVQDLTVNGVKYPDPNNPGGYVRFL
jgi:hypothetical protein